MVARISLAGRAWMAAIAVALGSVASAQDAPRRPGPRRPGQPSATAPAATAPASSETPATRPATSPAPIEPAAPLPAYEPLGYAARPGGGQAPQLFDDFVPLPDRWRIGIPGDYVQNARGAVYDPYNQNVLKGDYPILGDDVFFVVTATSDTLFEARRVPNPSGVSSRESGSREFFGSGEQILLNQNFILSLELFGGAAGFKPRDFEVKFTPVANLNYTQAEELGILDPDVREGRYRGDEWIGIQELLFEKHLGDLSPNYDFWSTRLGVQPFVSDFRGFLFADNEPGARLFGTFDNNHLQWNLAWFHQLEKDTNSGLNSYTARDQDVFIANVYRQDLFWKGYTAQASFHANLDRGVGRGVQLDDNGRIVRPAPIGTIAEKDVRAYYLGWAGDGHIGRLNLTHQYYWALGRETFNPIAGQGVDINAHFFALEVSYDRDYVRFRGSFAYASGDSDPEDGDATGFDSIFDNPNFAGGAFSYTTRQSVPLTGTGVSLFNRNSFLPDLRTSKEQGQANFVNPGLLLYNAGVDVEITPKLKAITNVSYLQFADTSVLELVLQDDKVSRDLAIDYSVGVQYRPWLNNNAIVTVGAAALQPLEGFHDLFENKTLYSMFVGLTFTY